MNLKYFYYNTYFDGLDLRQHPKKSEQRKRADEINEKAFREKNATLCAPIQQLKQVDNRLGLSSVHLTVQNPGLIPGVGYPHEIGYPQEFMLGFSFDHTSGLPVLPGHSVKGVLRSPFPQLEFGAETPWQWNTPSTIQRSKAKFIVQTLLKLPAPPANLAGLPADNHLYWVHRLELAIFEGISIVVAEKPQAKLLPMSKRDTFFEAQPSGYDDHINPDHRLLGRDAITPHGKDQTKNPIPLPFVKVMPGVVFSLGFRLSDTTVDGITVTIAHKLALFTILLEKLGAGAKTNTGYGRFATREKTGQGATPTVTTGGASTATAAPAKLVSKSATKWTNRDTIIGVVKEHKMGDVYFTSNQITESDWTLVAMKAPLADRLPVGKEIKKLRIVEVSAGKKLIKLKVEDYS
jgi:CRISPR-associated protein Cmr6